MSNFFDKLKKGMDIENIPQENPKEEADKEIFLEGSAFKEISIEAVPIAEETTGPEVEFSAIAPVKKPKKEKLKVKKQKHSPAPRQDDRSDLFEPEGELTVDIFETEKNIVIQSAVAGIDVDKLNISIEKDMIAISGRRERNFEETIENYYCHECYWGKFSKEIVLPTEVDTSKADAVMKNGVLTITIPKISKEKTNRLNVKEVE